MLYTLTTNPAIDMNIGTQGIQKNIVNRTYDTVYTPNGKGLNVSFVLGHFNIQSKILGFFGGFSGFYIVEESQKRGFQVLPVWIEGITRINIFLNDMQDEYKFVNAGAYVYEQKQKEMLKMIEFQKDMDILSISGSLSPGIEDSFYDELLQLCEKKGTKIILDISSKKLVGLLKYKPYLIKPNDEEIKDIFHIDMKDEQDIIDVLLMLHELGAQNILLTLGEKGAYFYNGKEILYASAHPITLLSSACAGDTALGAFLSVWLENEDDIEQALRRSAAAGANSAESNAIGDLAKVEEYEKNIIIRKVKSYA